MEIINPIKYLTVIDGNDIFHFLLMDIKIEGRIGNNKEIRS